MKTVLLIEDDPFLRNLYVDILKEENINVEIAVDGEEGLKKIQSQDWDLIMIDIVLPKLDGLQIYKKLKEQSPEKLKQKIVFLSNLDKNSIIEEIVKEGCDYLIKSKFNPDEFVNKVKSYLV